MSEEMNESRKLEFGVPKEEASSEPGVPPRSSDFEASLSSLAPRAARIDRDRTMFLAGQASLQASGAHQTPADSERRLAAAASTRGSWGWPAAFSVMTAAAAVLLAMLVNRPEPRVVERIVCVPIENPPQIASAQMQPQAPDGLADTTETAAGRQLESAPSDAYLRLRDRALAVGLEPWAEPVSSSASDVDGAGATYRALRDSLLQ